MDIDNIDDLRGEKLRQFIDDVLENTDGLGFNLYFAKKVIKPKKNENQEIKYKKFMLLNIVVAFHVLAKNANFCLKVN